MGRYAGIGEWIERGKVFNIKAYGAVSGGSASTNKAAFDAAITAAANYDTIYIPNGIFAVDNVINITKKLNIRGEGYGSQVYQSSNNHLFSYDASAVDGGWQYISIQDVHFRSTATTAGKSLFYARRLTDCYFSNVILRGGYYGIYMEGCLRNNMFNIMTDSSSAGYGSPSTMNTVIYITPGAWARPNANRIFGFTARGGSSVATNGLYYYGSTEGNLSIIGGTIEGLNGIGCKIQNATQVSTIDSLHIEDAGGAGPHFVQGLVLQDCQNSRISNCIIIGITADGVVLEDCKAVEISGTKATSVNIDGTNSMISIRESQQGTGTWSIAPSAVSIENVTNSIADTGNQYARWGGISPYGGVNLAQGDLEVWSGGLPLGFVNYGSCGIAEESTIVCFGDSSAKLTRSATAGVQGLRFSCSAGMTSDLLSKDALNIRAGNYTWTISGSGTNEYYLKLSGGDPDIDKPITVLQNLTSMREGTVGSLAANYWDYGDNDTLGYSTIYVRLSDGTDPDTKDSGYLLACYRYAMVTVSAYFYSPTTSGGTPGIAMWSVQYDSSTTTPSKTFTIPDNTWTRCTVSFQVSPITTGVRFIFGMVGGSTGDIVYVDGIEVMYGSQVSQHFINGARLNSKTPASAAATGRPGDICWDESYVYVCIGTDTWKRAAIATW